MGLLYLQRLGRSQDTAKQYIRSLYRYRYTEEVDSTMSNITKIAAPVNGANALPVLRPENIFVCCCGVQYM